MFLNGVGAESVTHARGLEMLVMVVLRGWERVESEVGWAWEGLGQVEGGKLHGNKTWSVVRVARSMGEDDFITDAHKDRRSVQHRLSNETIDGTILLFALCF